jgi:hypothetical protein
MKVKRKEGEGAFIVIRQDRIRDKEAKTGEGKSRKEIQREPDGKGR